MHPCTPIPHTSQMSTASLRGGQEAQGTEMRLNRQTAPSSQEGRPGRANSRLHLPQAGEATQHQKSSRQSPTPARIELRPLPPLWPQCWEVLGVFLSLQTIVDFQLSLGEATHHEIKINTGTLSYHLPKDGGSPWKWGWARGGWAGWQAAGAGRTMRGWRVTLEWSLVTIFWLQGGDQGFFITVSLAHSPKKGV